MAVIDLLNLIEFDFIRMVRLFSYYVVLNKEFGSSVTILCWALPSIKSQYLSNCYQIFTS
jgi:hypothetical protein